MADQHAANSQLGRPTIADAEAALRRLYGPHMNDVWATLLGRAGLTGAETDRASLDRLVSCMNSGDPITRICGRSLQLRCATYDRRAAAAKPVEGVPA